MGSQSSKKPEITISAIRTTTEDIRSSLRRNKKPEQNKENLHQILINNSKQLNTLRSKKSKKKQLEIDQLQKLVSDVSEELLEYNDDHLDRSADESHSFVHVASDQVNNEKSKPHTPSKTMKNLKISTTASNPLNKLYDIEQKLKKIKNDVTLGIKMDDNSLLTLQKKKIEMLSTDLELLNIPENSVLYKQQQILEKDLYRYYQKIIRREKTKSTISKERQETDGQNGDKIKLDSAKLKSLELMIEDIHDILQNFASGDKRCDISSLLDEMNKIKAQLNTIEDDNKENFKSKTILNKKLEQTKKYIEDVTKKKEMNDLDEIMDKIDLLRTDLQSKNVADKLKTMNNIKHLRTELDKFDVKSPENITFKSEYIKELDNFMNKGEPKEEVKMRQKILKSSQSVEDLMHLQEEWKSLEKSMSTTKEEEIERIDKLLERFEESIKAKRRSLADVLKKKSLNKSARSSVEVIRTSAKIYELPKLSSTKSTGNITQMKAEDTTPLKYGSVENLLEEMVKISDRVQEIGKEILSFKGTSEDLGYNLYRASLIEKRKLLENLNHRTSWNQVDAFKLEILEKINYFEDYLNYKLNQNILENELGHKLNNLDSRVKRFTGGYQNIQYNTIDDELTKCIKEAEKIDSPEKSDGIKSRISYLKSMLRERSKQDFEFEVNKNVTDTKKIITEIEEYIRNIKEKLADSKFLEMKELEILEDNLSHKSVELTNLSLKDNTPMFKNVKILLEGIKDCRELLNKKKIQSGMLRTDKIYEEIQNGLEKLQIDISNFDGLIDDMICTEIMKRLMDMEIQLGTVEDRDDIQGKKLELSLNINLSKTRLEQVALESGIIQEIEKRIWEILEITSADVPPDQYSNLDEELINLKIRLEKLEVSEKLSYRKITCLSYIEHLIKKLNDENNSRGKQISRSIIV